MKRSDCAALALIPLAIFLPSLSLAKYANWEECAKSEVQLLEKLAEVRDQGRDVRQYLEKRLGAKLDVDAEYLLWLFETRPTKKLAIVMMGKCALRYPDSSPFSKSDLDKMREAEEKAMQALRKKILERERRNPKDSN